MFEGIKDFFGGEGDKNEDVLEITPEEEREIKDAENDPTARRVAGQDMATLRAEERAQQMQNEESKAA